MRLKKAHLVNFCQHRDFEVEFSPGVTGILGGNGQGKSNLMKAIRFALIGESGNVGVKTEDLNWYAALNGEAGFVELIFEAGGQEGVLKRFVSSTRTSLKYGSFNTTSSVKATAALMDITGSTRGFFEDTVFVDQGKLETILFEKAATRAAKFQKLFGTERAEKLRQLLHQEVATLTTDPVDDRIKELEQELTVDIDPQLRALNKQSDQMKAELAQYDIDGLEAVVKAYEVSVTAKAQLADLLDQKNRCESGVDPHLLNCLLLEVQLLTEETDSKRVIANSARAHLVNIQGVRAITTTKQRLVEEINEYSTQLQKPEPKPPAVTEKQVEDAQNQIAIAQAEMARHTHFIQTFEQGSPICPTCNQPVQHSLARVEESKSIVEERQALIEQVAKILVAARYSLSKFQSEILAYSQEIETAKKLIARKTQELAELPIAADIHGNENELQHQITLFEQLEEQLHEKAKELHELEEKGAKSDGELVSITRQIEHISKHINEDITEEQNAKAALMLEQFANGNLALAEISGQLKQLHSSRIRVLAELGGLRSQAGGLVAKRKYKLLCDRTRELLHRDVLPRRVTQRYLAMLNVGLQEHMEVFEVPFSCDIDNELNVMCTIPGIGKKPAERLSGGQRVMLGIAFRFAICRLFAAGLGFVVLDEPTVMLDDDHVDIVVDLLNAIKGHLFNAGLQLLVPTHSPQLESTFDSVIRV